MRLRRFRDIWDIYILHIIYIFYSYKLFREKSMLYAWIKSESREEEEEKVVQRATYLGDIYFWHLLSFYLFSLEYFTFNMPIHYCILLIIILFKKTNTHRNRKGIYWHTLSIYWAAKGSSNEPRYIANPGMNTLL